jgi:hypothetical protein
VSEKPKKNFSPESRQKLSDLAKQRHAEGKLGGPKYGAMGGRAPKKKDRISKRVADAAEEERQANQIIEVFKDAIDPSQPISVRLKGAQAWVDIAVQHGKFELQEEAHEAAQHSREELIEMLSKKLTSGPTGSIIRKQIEEHNVIEGEAIEVEPDEQ